MMKNLALHINNLATIPQIYRIEIITNSQYTIAEWLEISKMIFEHNVMIWQNFITFFVIFFTMGNFFGNL